MPKPDGLAPDRAGFAHPPGPFWPFARAAAGAGGAAGPETALHEAQLCAAREAQAFWQGRAAGWQELWQAGAAAGLRAAFCAPADPASAIRELSGWQVHALQQTVQDVQDYADLCVRCGAQLLSGARRAGQGAPAEPAPAGQGAPRPAFAPHRAKEPAPRKAHARGHATPV